MKIGLITIATGQYTIFIPQLLQTMRKKFFPDDEKKLIEKGHALLQEHLERQRVLTEELNKKETELKEAWYAKEADFEKTKSEWDQRSAQKDTERDQEFRNRKSSLEKIFEEQSQWRKNTSSSTQRPIVPRSSSCWMT